MQFFSSPRGTASGIYCQYAIYGRVVRPQIDTCDFGINLENDSGNTKRQTTVHLDGGSIRTCLRALRYDDCVKCSAIGTSFENSSVGVYYDFTRTTGTNNAACSLFDCYFERNGRHIQVTEHGTGISRGISARECYFDNVATMYISTDAFEDAGSGVTKVDLDGSYHSIAWNYWSSAAANEEVLVRSGATGNYIGPQHAPSIVLTDNGTGTIDDRDVLTSVGAHTISGIHRHSVDMRLENAIALAGLNAAASSWRDLIQLSASDNVIVGSINELSSLHSSVTPTWYDGASHQMAMIVTATTTELEDVTDAINTRADKVEGYMVKNSTTNIPYWAAGNADADVWEDATGTTIHSPV